MAPGRVGVGAGLVLALFAAKAGVDLLEIDLAVGLDHELLGVVHARQLRHASPIAAGASGGDWHREAEMVP